MILACLHQPSDAIFIPFLCLRRPVRAIAMKTASLRKIDDEFASHPFPPGLAAPMTIGIVKSTEIPPISSSQRGFRKILFNPSHNPNTRSNAYADALHNP